MRKPSLARLTLRADEQRHQRLPQGGGIGEARCGVGGQAALDKVPERSPAAAVEQLGVEVHGAWLVPAEAGGEELQGAATAEEVKEIAADGVDIGGRSEQVVGLFAFGGAVARGGGAGKQF